MKLPKELADDLLARGEVGPPVQMPQEQPGRAGMPTGLPTGQGAFSLLCRVHDVPEPVYEHRFDTKRRWRFDMAWPKSKVAVEVQGGLWSQGRHVRGAALLKEYEKLNNAAIDGWCVLLVTPEQVEDGACMNLIKAALSVRVLGGSDA